MSEDTPLGTGPEPTPSLSEQRFWINTVSLDHVEAAAEGGFTQADHGARTRLGRPQPGDEMIFYSPARASKTALRSSSSRHGQPSPETSPTKPSSPTTSDPGDSPPPSTPPHPRTHGEHVGSIQVHLEADAPRVSCRVHGVAVAAVPWARHQSGHTLFFDDQVAWLATQTSKTAITVLMRIAWRTVGRSFPGLGRF